MYRSTPQTRWSVLIVTLFVGGLLIVAPPSAAAADGERKGAVDTGIDIAEQFLGDEEEDGEDAEPLPDDRYRDGRGRDDPFREGAAEGTGEGVRIPERALREGLDIAEELFGDGEEDEQTPDEPREPPTEPLSGRARQATGPGPLVALNPARKHAFVVAAGTDWYASDDVAGRLKRQLRRHVDRRGLPVHDLAFTPDGKGWLLLYRGGAAYYLPAAVASEVERLVQQGRQIRNVVFHPRDWERRTGFALVHEAGVVTKNVPGRLRTELNRLYGRKAILDVAISPDGNGWIITTGDGYVASRNDTLHGGKWSALSSSGRVYRYVLEGSKGKRRITDVAFDPWRWDPTLPGWSLLYAQGYITRHMFCPIGRRIESELGITGNNRTCYREGRQRQPEPGPKVTDRPEKARKKPPLPDATVEMTKFRVLKRQEKNGEDVGVLTLAWRGRAGDGGRVWYARDASDIRLFAGLGKDLWGRSITHNVGSGKTEVAFDGLKPYEMIGVMYVFVERDKSTHKKLHKVLKTVASRASKRFDRKCKALSRPPASASKQGKIRTAQGLLKAARHSLFKSGGSRGSIKRHFDRKLKKKPHADDLATRVQHDLVFWHARVPGVSPKEVERGLSKRWSRHYVPAGTHTRTVNRNAFSEPGKRMVVPAIVGPDSWHWKWEFVVDVRITTP